MWHIKYRILFGQDTHAERRLLRRPPGFYETIKITNNFVGQTPDFLSPPFFLEMKFRCGCLLSLRFWDEMKWFYKNILSVIFQALIFWSYKQSIKESRRPFLLLQTSFCFQRRFVPELYIPHLARFDVGNDCWHFLPDVSAARLIRSQRDDTRRTHRFRTPEIHYVFSDSLAVNTFGHSNIADNLNDASSSTCYYHHLWRVSGF